MIRPTLYTLGYLAPLSEERLQQLVAQGTLIADIRYHPTSHLPQWGQAVLQARLGDRYQHVKALGNMAYRAPGAIILYQPVEGVAQVVRLLAGGQSVALLCACRSPESCHRTLVASLIQEHLPEIPIRHLHFLENQGASPMTAGGSKEAGHGTNHH